MSTVTNDPNLRESIYRTFEKQFVRPAQDTHQQFLEIRAEEMQKAVGTMALGRVHEVCALMQDDSLLSMAALELVTTEGPDSHLATKFKYKVHGS
jgi:hypothetical protein